MKRDNFYAELTRTMRRQAGNPEAKDGIPLGKTVRRLRENAGLSGVELCRRSGGIDPRTLSAIETGRIRNPSLDALHAIARGLGCLVRDLFTQMELGLGRNYHIGSQKGSFEIRFPKSGLTLISATPPSPYFFCGKLILAPKGKAEGELLARPVPLFIEVVMGRIEIDVEKEKTSLKEGENIFFNGGLNHSFRNLSNRESVLWLVTAPSFFAA